MECSLNPVNDGFELVIERRFAHPPAKVWRVLTERALLKQWFPCDIEGEWTPGSKLRFIFLNDEDKGLSEEELRGEVLFVDPPNRLEFSWGKYRYVCELTADGAGCLLRFTEKLNDPSEGARSATGWEFCFENFDAILQGAEIAIFAYDLFMPKFKKYVKKFEPVFGPQQGIAEN